MADKVGQADIRGLDVDKLAKGFADEEFVFKRFLTPSTTAAREIRWYQKTAGVLVGTTTSGVTANYIANAGSLGKPTQVNPQHTRQTSYVKEYIADSDWMSDADLKDCDLDILATTVRDVTRAVASQVDTRIWNVLTENLTPSNINQTNAIGTGWDDTTNGNPIGDILSGSMLIRQNGYDISNLTLLINPIEYKNLMNFIITVKGSSIPNFSSSQMGNSVMTRILNADVVVSNNATTDYALLFVPQRAATWKSFSPITAAVITEELIGKKVRVREEGEAILTDPKCVTLITDTKT
jgi:hypothetical protein